MKKLWLLNPGHGGLIRGEYQTPDSHGRKFYHPQKGWFYEGHSNRLIVHRLLTKCIDAGYDAVNIVPELDDIYISERVRRTNVLYAKHPQAIALEIHSNGFDGRASGWEGYTSYGETQSDMLMTIMYDCVRKVLRPAMNSEGLRLHLRTDTSDGDVDKENRHAFITKTKCPALLTENLFFDNMSELDFLMSEKGINAIVDAHFEFIERIENEKYDFSTTDSD